MHQIVYGGCQHLMASEEKILQFAVEPYRIGFVVDEQSPEQIKQAFGLAARFWGGERSPIIPVSSDGTVAGGWLQIATDLRPRRLIDLTCRGLEPSAWTEAKDPEWESILTPHYPKLHPVGQVHPLVVHPDPWAARLSVFTPSTDSMVDLAGLGRLADDERAEWAELGVTVLRADTEVDSALAQISGNTLLGSAAFRDGDYYTSGTMMSSTALIWVVNDYEDAGEALAFWNTRALRPRMGSPAVSVIVHVDDLANENIRQPLSDAIRNSASTVPQCNLVSQKVDQKGLEDLAQGLGFTVQQAGRWQDQILSRMSPVTGSIIEAAINTDMRAFWGGPRESGVPSSVLCGLGPPSSQLRLHSPLDFNRRLIGGGAVILRLRDPLFGLPPARDIGSLFYPNAQTEAGSLYIITNPRPTYDLNLAMPSRAAILGALARTSGLRFELSDKGRQIQGIYSRVVADKEMFRHPLFVPVVKALTPQTSLDIVKRLDALVEAGARREALDEIRMATVASKVAARTINQIKSHKLLNAAPIPEIASLLDRMVREELVQRGFRMSCSLCGLPSFFSTHDSVPIPKCAGCGSDGTYDIGSSAEPTLVYKLSSLLTRLSVNGGLGPLAALRTLHSEGAYVIPGANLFGLTDGKDLGEVDFVGYNGQQLFSGEAKSSLGFFTAEQIDKDVAHTVALNATTHIAVCLEEFTDDVRAALVATTEAHGLALRTLDASNLWLAS